MIEKLVIIYVKKTKKGLSFRVEQVARIPDSEYTFIVFDDKRDTYCDCYVHVRSWHKSNDEYGTEYVDRDTASMLVSKIKEWF